MDESQETDFLDEVPDTPRDTEKSYRSSAALDSVLQVVRITRGVAPVTVGLLSHCHTLHGMWHMFALSSCQSTSRFKSF